MGQFGIYFWIAGVAILASAVAFFKTPRGKGILGEWIVDLSLGKSKPGFRIVNNMMFHDGVKSVQIDHVVVTNSGIFVIETKNYAGRIYGDEDSDFWTQVLAYGKVKNKLYNPISQNKGHIYSLRKASPLLASINFQSIVVFTGGSQLMMKTTTPIVRPIAVKKTVVKKSSTQSIDETTAEKVYQELLSLKNSNTISLREHVHSIQARQDGIKANVCPRCGGALVERKGKSNTFIGCSNYPKCTFTKK